MNAEVNRLRKEERLLQWKRALLKKADFYGEEVGHEAPEIQDLTVLRCVSASQLSRLEALQDFDPEKLVELEKHLKTVCDELAQPRKSEDEESSQASDSETVSDDQGDLSAAEQAKVGCLCFYWAHRRTALTSFVIKLL